MSEKVETPSRSIIRILIVDDSPIFRRGIRACFEEQPDCVIIGETDDRREALRLCEQNVPEILLHDPCLARPDGRSFLGILRDRFPGVRQVVFIAAEDEASLTTCIMHNVQGYLLKNASSDLILKAVRSAAGGDCWLQREMTNMMLNQFRHNRVLEHKHLQTNLSGREVEVIKLLARGMRNQEIANQLFISEHTVKVHVTNIFDKLGVRDRVEAVCYAIRSGMVPV
ncbi:MAG: LuxR C-terminal-related transcriptional regulator [Armatimonadota bacterium]